MTTYHVMRRSEAEIHQFAAKGTYLAEMTCSKIFWSNINQKYSVKDLGFINWARNRGLGWGVRYLGKFFKLKEPPPQCTILHLAIFAQEVGVGDCSFGWW